MRGYHQLLLTVCAGEEKRNAVRLINRLPNVYCNHSDETHTHSYTSFNKHLKIKALICCLRFLLCTCAENTHIHNASLSKAFKIKTPFCLVCDVLCIYKVISQLERSLSQTPTSHFLAQQGGQRYSLTISLVTVAPITVFFL